MPKPYRQGALDCLCGTYSIINALRAAKGEAPLSLDAMRSAGMIEYIEFPQALSGKYQSFTEADIGQLRRAGYTDPFLDVGEGVRRYVDVMLRKGWV